MLQKVKSVIAGVCIAFLLLGVSACDEDDYELISKGIRSATAFAFSEVLKKNPHLLAPVCSIAQVNKDLILDRELNTTDAANAMDSVLEALKGMDEESKESIKQFWATIVPLINLPEDKLLKDPQLMYVLSFYNGILDVCKIEQDLAVSHAIFYKI